MADGLALASDGGRFHPRAALLSLVGHGLAFGVAAAFATAPRLPDPAPAYAVLFEMPAPQAETLQTQTAAAPERVAAAEFPPEPEPVPVPGPIPEPTPVAELALIPAPPAKPARPRAPRPPRPAAVAAEIAPAPIEAPVAADAIIATETRAIAESALAVQTASLPAPVAAPPAEPAPIPVVTEARFRAPPVPPVYPRRAVELGLRGTAVLRALVQPDGSTSEIVVWRSSGVESLDAAALGAVRNWRFEPARRDGDAIVAWVEIPVRFELN